MPLLRRYAPFAIPTVALLLLVILTPSKASTSATVLGGTGPQNLTTGSTPAGVPATGGNRTHCVGGLQFGGVFGSPPCQPDWTGRPNSGAGAPGVTQDKVTVVFYKDADNPAVKAIEQQAGGYLPTEQQQAFLLAATKFINTKYELWGRQVDIQYFQGKCTPTLPDPTCFNNDAKALITKYHPFAVVYQQDTNAPTFFNALSQAGVVSFGGWSFSQSYDQQQRPYHYDVTPDGNTQAALAAGYWCNRLVGKPARFAGPAYQNTRRRAGIITVDAPQNVLAAQALAADIKKCDPAGATIVKYSPDPSTATSQAGTLIATLRKSGVTSMLWFSDPVAPVFFSAIATQQRYFPENVLVGSGLLDQDPFGQAYDKQQWAHAFGLSSSPAALPLAQEDAAKVWKFAGGQGVPALPTTLTWNYMSVLADGLQQAGPTLTAASFERGLLTLPAFGGSGGHPLIKFGEHDYTGVQDAASVVWNPNKISVVNGKKGAYQLIDGGRRFTATSWPTTEPAVTAGQAAR